MKHPVQISEIKDRAEHIGLTLRKLAQKAGVSPSVAYQGAAGMHETRRSKEWALTEVLVAEELRVLQHLLKLHGCRLVDPVPAETLRSADRAGEAA